MSILTKEEILNFPKTTYGRALGKTIASKVMNELLQYKDLEEQIGCPLEVVFKAIYSGIYYIYPNGNIVLERSFKLNHYSSGWCLIKPKLNFKLEDYKKTWWLKRDKSE